MARSVLKATSPKDLFPHSDFTLQVHGGKEGGKERERVLLKERRCISLCLARSGISHADAAVNAARAWVMGAAEVDAAAERPGGPRTRPHHGA
jgi:hypothetical protein